MAAAADPLPPPPAAEEEEEEEQQQEEGAPYSPALTVESDIDYAAADVQEIAALSPPPSPEPPDDSTTIAFSMPTPAVVEDRSRKKSLEESGEELLAPPWSRSRCINRASSRQPTSPGPSGPRLESYPSFLNSRCVRTHVLYQLWLELHYLCRRSVDMSTCSSPNVFRTLQKSPSRRANLEETYPALDPKCRLLTPSRSWTSSGGHARRKATIWKLMLRSQSCKSLRWSKTRNGGRQCLTGTCGNGRWPRRRT
ncbi:uncharacterized protein LOC112342656 isoform X3 [Selaginella moellendorffii]|uniref:uncharacterized protein LOC112342656 isoform X3 n=1 Tax=Selaginella moellendorffii TaxID=88036 RepID=UPI000D1CB691|nr:uncharacterized protein LOC112342656 isoform X3 [Selaginella moellendorffii]|eukprot:XP_024520547.1 uncharacterized protein LOC112342656 isoform X3 [Selaginella moellendorffii]